MMNFELKRKLINGMNPGTSPGLWFRGKPWGIYLE
jgi:hypothetical protein